MNYILLVSNILLWLFMILQIMTMVYLSKLFNSYIKNTKQQMVQINSRKLQVGEHAPLIRSKDSNGTLFRSLDYRGNGEDLYLLFFSETCGICQEVISNLNQIDSPLNDITLVGITEGITLEKFKSKIHPNFRVVVSKETVDNFQLEQFPALIVIDNEGKIKANQEISSYKHLIYLIQDIRRTNIAS